MTKKKGPATASRWNQYRDKLIETVILVVPLGLVAKLGGAIQDRALAAPWQMLWVAAPLVAVGWLTWRFVRNEATPLRHWRWAVLLGVYGTVFALLSVTDLLSWRQVREPGESVALREWMLPVSLGDWRYHVAHRKPSQWEGLQVVLLDPPSATHERTAVRAQEAQLVRWSMAGEKASGLAFDAYFESHTGADADLCGAISSAAFPVLSGFSQQRLPTGLYLKRPITSALACLVPAHQGHLMGFADVDGRVRSIPHWWRGQQNQPAFSVRVAQTIPVLSAVPPIDPAQQELRFLAPSDAITVLHYADVEAAPALLAGHFNLVGLDTTADRFETPFGLLPGTLVQAYAVHSILSGSLIVRPPPLWSALMVFVSCYGLMLLAAQGRSSRILVMASVAVTMAIVALSAVCMALWLVWLDVIYGIVATWLWLAVLLVARKRWAGL